MESHSALTQNIQPFFCLCGTSLPSGYTAITRIFSSHAIHDCHRSFERIHVESILKHLFGFNRLNSARPESFRSLLQHKATQNQLLHRVRQSFFGKMKTRIAFRTKRYGNPHWRTRWRKSGRFQRCRKWQLCRHHRFFLGYFDDGFLHKIGWRFPDAYAKLENRRKIHFQWATDSAVLIQINERGFEGEWGCRKLPRELTQIEADGNYLKRNVEILTRWMATSTICVGLVPSRRGLKELLDTTRVHLKEKHSKDIRWPLYLNYPRLLERITLAGAWTWTEKLPCVCIRARSLEGHRNHLGRTPHCPHQLLICWVALPL